MPSPVVETVRKLLAKANDPSVSETEAAAFAAGAASVLARHGLSMADMPETERDDGVVQETWEPRWAHDGWRRLVAMSAAELYMCELIGTRVYDRTPDGKGYAYDKRTGKPTSHAAYIVVGRPHNVETTRIMCEYLFDTVVRLGRQYSKHRATYLEFERGCGLRLSTRLTELRRETTRPTPVDQPGSGLPALYASEADLVKNFVDANMNIRQRTIRTGRLGEHADAGAAHADRVSLSPQVGSSPAGAGRLLS